MLSIIEEAKRCLQCAKPACVNGCPVRTAIPEVIDLFLSGHINAAGELLFRNNPLSVVCSYICPHENNCQGHCVLGKKGQPINFFDIEQYISSFYLETLKPPIVTKNGYKVGIIGSGPAGITMAFILALRGFDVTIIDARDKIGGVLRYGIPDFRLPKTILDKIEDCFYTTGIRFRPNTLIGTVITVDDMFRDGYDALFIGTGVWRPMKLGLEGESLGHVHFAIDYLKNPSCYRLGKKVAIIGAGNVAMDVARTILRNSHSDVFIIHHRGPEQITATRYETEMAKLDGVRFEHFKQTLRVIESGVECAEVDVTINDEGKEDYYVNNDKRITFIADSVIIAVGQGPQSNIVSTAADIDTNAKGLLVADGTGQTTREGVFAAGDVVTGPKTVAEAVAFTKRVADEIERYCRKKRS